MSKTLSVICKVDKRLVVPPKFKGFPNEEELVFEFEAGIEKEVPSYVAEYWSKNYPHVYSIVGVVEKKSVLEDDEIERPVEEDFDPIEWIEINYNNIESIEHLLYKNIQKVGAALKLKVIGKSKDRLVEMIKHDIEVKKRHEEELEKHKDAM